MASNAAGLRASPHFSSAQVRTRSPVRPLVQPGRSRLETSSSHPPARQESRRARERFETLSTYCSARYPSPPTHFPTYWAIPRTSMSKKPWTKAIVHPIVSIISRPVTLLETKNRRPGQVSMPSGCFKKLSTQAVSLVSLLPLDSSPQVSPLSPFVVSVFSFVLFWFPFLDSHFLRLEVWTSRTLFASSSQHLHSNPETIPRAADPTLAWYLLLAASLASVDFPSPLIYSTQSLPSATFLLELPNLS